MDNDQAISALKNVERIPSAIRPDKPLATTKSAGPSVSSPGIHADNFDGIRQKAAVAATKV